jgi:hypothetical protein
MDLGIRDVPLADIDLSDSPVHGPDDFRKVSEPDMREGLRKLAEVVLPAVAGGLRAQHFDRLDAERGLDYEHGYRRVFDAFYGNDAIRLERTKDRYVVVNGYHRLTLARALGWLTVPARVIASVRSSGHDTQSEGNGLHIS